MKKELLHSLRKGSSLMIIALVLLFASCAIGYHDDETFNSGVRDTQLESPDLSKLSVKSIIVDGEEKLFLEWPVVYGAGGYTFSLYIVNDPENPIVVGEGDQVVDGCSVTREKLEDTKYEVVVQTLGNEKDNNKGALSATKGQFNTFVPTVAVIPDGADLAEYFAANPVSKSDTEQGYELVAGGSYTLNGTVDLGGHWLTLHGTKGDNPKITYGEEGKLSTWGGLKLKYIDFDCSAIPAGKTGGALLTLGDTPNDSIKGEGDHYFIENEIGIQGCEVTGINQHLVYDNKVKYCAKRFRIQNSVININSTKETIFFEGGFANEIYLIQNTFNGLVESSSYLVKYNNNGRPARAGLTGGLTINNNTFYNVVKNGKMGNYSGMDHASASFTMGENIFVDCSSGLAARHFLPGGNVRNNALSFGINSYLFDGKYVPGEASYDTSGKIVGAACYDKEKPSDTECADQTANPQFRDPAKGDFTVRGAEHLTNRLGDPRWLPAVE